MRTRNKSFDDYGFEDGEEKRIREYCGSAGFYEHDILLQSAISANPDIGSDIYYSLVRVLSYERLTREVRIPMSKNDFYGYRRKCLSNFKKQLASKGKALS